MRKQPLTESLEGVLGSQVCESPLAISQRSKYAPSHRLDPGILCLARALAETNFYQISRERVALRAKRGSGLRWFLSILRS